MRRILASLYAIGDSVLAEVFFKLGFLSFVARVRAAGACNKFSALMAIARAIAARAEAGRSPLLARNEPITFSARWWRGQVWCRRARPVARRVLCAALGAALCVRCGVLGAVLFARFAAPDGALSQTSARLRAASWAWRVWWWSGLQRVTPSELQARLQVQTQPRILGTPVIDAHKQRPSVIPLQRRLLLAPCRLTELGCGDCSDANNPRGHEAREDRFEYAFFVSR